MHPRRFEKRNSDTNTDKFWEVKVEGKTVVRTYGRIGSRGTSVFNAQLSEVDAGIQANKYAAEKITEGYKELDYDPLREEFTRRTYTPPLYPSMYPKPSLYKTEYIAPATPVLAPNTSLQGHTVVSPGMPATVHVPYYNPYTAPVPTAYKSTELDKMPPNVLLDLAAKVKVEMERRNKDNEYRTRMVAFEKDKKIALHNKLSNFLLGVAHACACRSALRFAAGHNPHGKTPMSGECWNAIDGVKVERCVSHGSAPDFVNPKRDPTWSNRRLRSNPLRWETPGDIRHWLDPYGLRSSGSTPPGKSEMLW